MISKLCELPRATPQRKIARMPAISLARRVWVLIAAALLLMACAGPKGGARVGGSFVVSDVPIFERTLVVRNFEGPRIHPELGRIFTREVTQQLRDGGLFSAVLDGNSDRTSSAELELRGRVEDSHEPGFADRAIWGVDDSVVLVSGSIVVIATGEEVLSFSRSRSSAGGVGSAGGFLSASDKKLAEKLTEWIAWDVGSILDEL